MPQKKFATKLSEADLAKSFIADHKEQIRFEHDTKTFFLRPSSGQNWRADKLMEAFHLAACAAEKIADNYSNSDTIQKAAFINSTLKYHVASNPEIATTRESWNRDAYLLGTPSGKVDLKKPESVRDSDASDLINKETAVDPSDEEDCPLWKAFLNEICSGDDETVGFLQAWFGYCLTGDMKEQKLLFIVGPGGNGKGVLLRTIAKIMADYAITAPQSAFIDMGNTHPTDLATLHGPRLAWVSEIDKGGKWREAPLNAVTGADDISARGMRQDFFTFTPSCKLTFVGNSMPNIKYVSEGIRRRFLVLPIEYKPAKPDHDLEKKLRVEWPAILRWVLNGCLQWQQAGLKIPHVVASKTAEYIQAQNVFEQFINEECEVGQGLFEPVDALFAAWSNFLSNRNEDRETARDFGQRMTMAGFKSQPRNISGKSTRCRIGLQLSASSGQSGNASC